MVEPATAVQGRHERIRVLPRRHLGREVSHSDSTGLGQSDQACPGLRDLCPWPELNNFVHLVHLTASSAASDNFHNTLDKPGTKCLPLSTPLVVVRVSNSDAMLHNKFRVENEVAAMCLMHDALSAFPTKMVPDVYAWNSSSDGNGWIVQEYMPGSTLATSFSGLSPEKKRSVLDQVAHVFHLIQSYVPNRFTFGDLRFDRDGKVCRGELSIWGGGPFEKYADMYTYIFHTQLERSRSFMQHSMYTHRSIESIVNHQNILPYDPHQQCASSP